MSFIALLISLLVAALGAWGIVFPQKLLALARLFESQVGLWVAAVLRIAFGLALYQAAATSLAPKILGVVGVIIIAIGIATPLLGVKRTRLLLDWWEARGLLAIRIWGGVALVLGVLLVSAVVT